MRGIRVQVQASRTVCATLTAVCSPADEVGVGVVEVGGEIEVLLDQTTA